MTRSEDVLVVDEARALLEREHQLSLITDLLSGLRRGRGELAVVLAGAGLGKTTLLDHSERLATDIGIGVLRARGSEIQRDMPFGIARQLFETTVRRLTAARRDHVLSGAAGHTRSLLGLTEEPAGDLLGVLHGLYWLLANLSDDGPLLLLVDDLHWADAQSARWIGYLAGRMSALPVLVLAAARPSEPGGAGVVDQITDHPDPVKLSLSALSADAAAELLRSRLDRTGEEEFVAACCNATGGNPFFLHELLRAATRDGLEPTAQNASVVPELGTREIARSILVRLGRLGTGAERLAKAAAVLGDDSALHHAANLADLCRDDALDAWDALLSGEILRAGQPLQFIHPIVRTAIYREIGPGELTRAHRRAAEILDADGEPALRIAAHALACEPAADPDVVAWLRDAASKAMAEGAPDAAVKYLRRALAEPPAPELRPRLHFEIGQALIGLDTLAAAQHLGQAATTGPVSERLAARTSQAWSLAYSGRLADMLEAYEDAIQLAGPGSDLALQLGGRRDFYVSWWPLDPERSRRRERVREQAATLAGSTVGERQVLAAVAASAVHEGVTPASEVLELATRLNRSELPWLGREHDIAPGCAAFVRIMCDEPAAIELLERSAIPQCLSAGRSVDLAYTEAWLAISQFRLGALVDAEETARRAWEVMQEVGASNAVVYAWSAAALIEILIARGAFTEAAALLDRTGLDRQPPAIVLFPWPPVLRGELLLAQGEIAAGVDALLHAGAWVEESGFANPAYIPWRARVTPGLVALGRSAEARAVIEPAVRRARQFGAPWALGMALRAAGLAEQGDRRIELLRESVAILHGSGCRLEHAHALLELGAALRRVNQRAEARQHLRASLDLAHRCGAQPLSARAESELASTGARPRRLLLTGVDSLTASERRVAELAADGASNPEIAQQLFVTRKTIETHLGHVYQKLGINSRQERPAALGRVRP